MDDLFLKALNYIKNLPSQRKYKCY